VNKTYNNNNNGDDYDDGNDEYYNLAIKTFDPLLTRFNLISPSVSSKVFAQSCPMQFVIFNDLEVVSLFL